MIFSLFNSLINSLYSSTSSFRNINSYETFSYINLHQVVCFSSFNIIDLTYYNVIMKRWKMFNEAIHWTFFISLLLHINMSKSKYNDEHYQLPSIENQSKLFKFGYFRQELLLYVENEIWQVSFFIIFVCMLTLYRKKSFVVHHVVRIKKSKKPQRFHTAIFMFIIEKNIKIFQFLTKFAMTSKVFFFSFFFFFWFVNYL